MRDDVQRLQDILDAIVQVERYASHGQEVFEQNELVQVWIVHHIQIIGEASRHISWTLRQQHSEIAWPQIGAMRNVLIHEYFGLDMQEVWATVTRDLPDLKRKIEAILQGYHAT